MAVAIPNPMQESIPLIITIGELSQYTSGNAISQQNAFQGGSVTPNIEMILYMERKAVQWDYINNPTDPTLQGSANYLYSLYGVYGAKAIQRLSQLEQSAPTITNPSPQSVNVGSNATFTVTVTSGLPYTIQWYLNGVEIIGATSLSYTVINAQLSQSGGLYSATATNTAGTVSSNTALLTVTQLLVGYYYYGSTDYSTQLEASTDDVPYLGTFTITNGQPLSITFPSAAANQFFVIKYPSSQSIKTSYTNLPLNTGIIPNIAWNAILTFGGFNYIFTRTGNVFGLNYLNPLIFS
jgi:hypothetical protein